MNPLDSATGIINAAVSEFGDSLAILTSFQREGVVIVDLALKTGRKIPVATINTGRLPRSTLEMIAQIEKRYGVKVERIQPDQAEVQAMVAKHGQNLFYDGVAQRTLCCNVRKVRPLVRWMTGRKAYFTGLRRAQSEVRADIDFVDRTVSGAAKISPLADWSAEDVARYTVEHGLPVHPLYAAGYTSIGCDPCTRAVAPGEDERAGRWWWEDSADKECGIHFSPDGKVERTVDVLLRDLLEKVHA